MKGCCLVCQSTPLFVHVRRMGGGGAIRAAAEREEAGLGGLNRRHWLRFHVTRAK